MLGLFRSKTRWQKIPHGAGDFGGLKLNDNGSLSIGSATFVDCHLEEAQFGDYVFNFDGRNLSIRGPKGTATFKYSAGFWHSFVPS
jgi:hypothetical protein